MKLKRIIIALALLLGLAIMIGGVWTSLREEADQRHAIADGSIVTLRGVTYGKRHRIADASGWQRMVGRILPDRFARQLGIPVIGHFTTNDTAVVWLEIDTRMMAGTTALFNSVTTRVAIRDTHGSEFFHIATTGSRSGGGRILQGYVVPILPPGRDNLTVTVHRSDWSARRHYRADLPLPRPTRPRRGAWSAPTLPSTSRVDNLQFVLQALEMTQVPSPGGTEAMCKVDCLVLEDGLPTTNWILRMVDVFDESGAYQRIETGRLRIGQPTLRVGLSTNHVWRLRFYLARIAGFASNDFSTVHHIPLTISERAAFRPATNPVNGVNLVLYDVAGFGVIKLSTFLIPRDATYETVLVQVIDDKGRDLVMHTRTPGFDLKAARDSRTADATFAVTRMQSVEVFVRPIASPNLGSIFPSSAK